MPYISCNQSVKSNGPYSQRKGYAYACIIWRNPSASIHKKKSSKTFYFQSRSISLYSCKSQWLFIKETLCTNKEHMLQKNWVWSVADFCSVRRYSMCTDRSWALGRILLIWGMVNNICHVLPRVIGLWLMRKKM